VNISKCEIFTNKNFARGMKDFSDTVFYEEMARLMPGFLRAITFRQENVLTKGNIAISHILVADVLSEKGPCTMGEIARELNYTMSAATAIIDKMLEQGLVSRNRDEADRRVVRVSLVSGGKALEKKMYEFRRNVTEDLYSALSAKEKKEFLRMVKKAYASMTKKGDGQTKN
jgi:DNA-binding MarR family transcriptional regulator